MRTSKDFRARTRTKILGQQGLPEEIALEDNQNGGGDVVAGGGGGCERASARRSAFGRRLCLQEDYGFGQSCLLLRNEVKINN